MSETEDATWIEPYKGLKYQDRAMKVEAAEHPPRTTGSR